MKPNFLVIGAMKCATTTLCADLAHHPDVFMPTPREVDFFPDGMSRPPEADFQADKKNWHRGFEWYESLFEKNGGAKAVGEGSTSFTKSYWFPEVVERVSSYLPEAKLIYLVRNPFKRIESHWRHNATYDRNSLDFNESLRKKWFNNYVDISLYWKQINLYRKHYPDKQILVLFTEDYRKDRNIVLRKAFEFLEVDPDLITEPQADRNVSVGREVDTPLIKKLRKISLTRIVPKGLKTRIKASLSHKLPGEVQWDPDLRKRAEDIIFPDSEKFLQFYGKPFTFWSVPESFADCHS